MVVISACHFLWVISRFQDLCTFYPHYAWSSARPWKPSWRLWSRRRMGMLPWMQTLVKTVVVLIPTIFSIYVNYSWYTFIHIFIHCKIFSKPLRKVELLMKMQMQIPNPFPGRNLGFNHAPIIELNQQHRATWWFHPKATEQELAALKRAPPVSTQTTPVKSVVPTKKLRAETEAWPFFYSPLRYHASWFNTACLYWICPNQTYHVHIFIRHIYIYM